MSLGTNYSRNSTTIQDLYLEARIYEEINDVEKFNKTKEKIKNLKYISDNTKQKYLKLLER